MKAIGIIAEFNPFHNGHKYLIEQAKALTGADCCVVIMSGDFVQRGAPAVCNKYLRTEMALKGGADIVFELPVIYSLGSAETFSDGAVRLLSATGQIDYICFGSESGDTEALSKCASIIEEYTATSAFKEQLSSYIKSGVSYPSAFSKALSEALGSLQSLLYTPNNLLSIEYIRALLRLKSLSNMSASSFEEEINSQTNSDLPQTYQEEKTVTKPVLHIPEPFAIQRKGSDHFDTTLTDFSSATAIRELLYSGSGSNAASVSKSSLAALQKTLPADTYDILTDKYMKYLPITEDDFSSMLYMRLNTMSDEELFSIPDINPDLIHKISEYRGKQIVISDLIMDLKSKCFTYTAISRALFRILLSPNYICAYNNVSKPYLRVLGFKKSCSEFLRNLRYSDQINIITKPADFELENPSYNLDIFASNLYEQVCFEKFKTGFSEELKTGPIIL